MNYLQHCCALIMTACASGESIHRRKTIEITDANHLCKLHTRKHWRV